MACLHIPEIRHAPHTLYFEWPLFPGVAVEVIDRQLEGRLSGRRPVHLELLLDGLREVGTIVHMDVVTAPLGITLQEQCCLIDTIDDAVAGYVLLCACDTRHGREDIRNVDNISGIGIGPNHPRPAYKGWHPDAVLGGVRLEAAVDPLVGFLWYGMVTEARQYLDTIPAEDLKDPPSIERLKKSLERNEGSIPCYALRSRLGLPNGSSPVESANNQVTARRQKRNGMSWSKAGSHALTALSVLVCNRCQAIWVREHTVPLRFVNKAA